MSSGTQGVCKEGPSATERYVADFKAFAGNGASRAPAWMREIREAAIARFAELGFPTTRQEAWRFTSVAPIAEAPFALAPPAPSVRVAADQLKPLFLSGPQGYRAVFVNGIYSASLSAVSGLPAGVRIGSLAEALAADAELAQRHLARYAHYQDSPFAALNTAFLADGAFVYVAPDTVLEQPLELLFLSTVERGPTVSHPRNLVIIDRGAGATVVETHAALADGVYWTNAVTELVIGDGARAELYRIQRESRLAYHVATTQSYQGQDSMLRLHAVAFGAALARHDINAVLDGRGAELILNGLYLLAGNQHVDHHTLIDHAKPRCASHEYFNGVLDGRAHGVFSGRIIVRKGAQRTDSKQTNNNLLLSAEARADSQPQLEIYADDVKCTHGSTVGPLDQTALYYLESRGLSPEAARAILTYGFGAEILGRMEHAGLRGRLDAQVRAQLQERGGD